VGRKFAGGHRTGINESLYSQLPFKFVDMRFAGAKCYRVVFFASLIQSSDFVEFSEIPGQGGAF